MRVKKIIGLIAALLLLSISDAQAQNQVANAGYCKVSGTVKSNVVSNRSVFVVINGRNIRASTDMDGRFQLIIPKGVKIQHSNIRKLIIKHLKKTQ